MPGTRTAAMALPDIALLPVGVWKNQQLSAQPASTDPVTEFPPVIVAR
jgi:hypothetical protein